MSKGNTRVRFSQFKGFAPLLIFIILALTSCGAVDKISEDFSEFSKGLRADFESENSIGFLGGLATDEPTATIAGRNILAAGGNAVDAAVAVYFSLAVTMPSVAGLGGGGVCVVHDAQSNVTKALDFLSKIPERSEIPIEHASAVPGNVAGFSALHARYGRLPWTQLIAPAESLARFGIKVSRSFSNHLEEMGYVLISEPATNNIFGHKSERRQLKEGDKWLQPDLANIIGKIREKGSAALYRGTGAQNFANAVVAAGGFLRTTDLTKYRPVWRNPIEVPLGYISVHFAPPPAAGGAVSAEILAMLLESERYIEANPEDRPHLFVEAVNRAYADRSKWMQADGNSNITSHELVSKSRISKLMSDYRADSHVSAASQITTSVRKFEDASATSFVVMDEDGSAVACAVSMNSLFGNKLIAANTGILMASIPNGQHGSISLGPMLAVDSSTNNFFFAGGASGGVTAPTALMYVALSNVVNVESLEDSVLAKRLHHSGNPDVVYYEQGYKESVIQNLIKKGHRVVESPSFGLVNAVGCLQGLTNDMNSCEVATDPRGFGLAVKIHD